MDFINQILGYPLGWLMWLCYQITSNYALSLLVFTVLTKLILLPLIVNQQKSMGKMAMLRPQMDEIQKKYAKNKEKLNEEMTKLYSRENYNPMSGCLPLLIQFPILFGLIDVIYKPLYHILRLPAEVINAGTAIAGTELNRTQVQLAIVRGVKETPELYESLGANVIEQIQSFNLNLFGMDLTQIPHMDLFKQIFSNGFNLLLLIPIFSGISSLLLSVISMRNTAGNDAAGGASMKGMMLTMPLISTWIAFTVPAGVGLYWFYSNITSAIQSLILHKIYNPKEMAEKARQEYSERQEKERQERLEAKKLAREGKLENAEKGMTQKELNRHKLAEARRRDAEKYGEEYVEVTDEDLK